MPKTLLIEVNKSVATITLNRPQARNALNGEMVDELRALIEQLKSDAAARAVILTGAGKTFSAGADVEMLMRLNADPNRDATRAEIGKWRAAFDALECLPQITVAAINGIALGGGVVLALACDFRIASSRAIFGLPEIKLGMVLALGGTQRLTRLVGISAAKEMILRGRNVTAPEAQRLGLVNRVCDPGDLMGLARNWADREVNHSARARALAKDLINESYQRTPDESAEAETIAQVELLHSPEFASRVKALKESGEI
ncbi:MAG: enoyl-CoA hydratase/isomerase family protein [Chloroflexi bacterium]|nr:enoyl-CoA hydratase/isomerase family protein [Chloroflexota bacterium]